MTLYTNSIGAQVFATGSMQWNWGLDDFGSEFSRAGTSHVHRAAQQMTHNVLRTFSGRSNAPVVFVNVDSVTSGNWANVYGSDGYIIAAGTGITNIPTYLSQPTIQGQQVQVWEDPSSDPRALLKPGSSDRIAAAWTTTNAQNSAFTIGLNFTNGSAHQVTLYCADWLGSGTILEKVEVFESSDTSYASPLDTRRFQLPTNGIYFVWKLSGHKTIRVTKPDAAIGNKAMVSAIFFDPIP